MFVIVLILGSIAIPRLEKRELVIFRFFVLCTVCHGLFAFPLAVIGRLCSALQKHAYSNILRTQITTKNENFQMKNSDSFHISAQNIGFGYLLEPPQRGGSNEYPQSMF